MRSEDFIERRIITGLIVSSDYVRKVAPFWRDEFIESPELRRVARWCLDHFEQYDRAPERDIEALFMSALKAESVGKAEAELIEVILTRISDDFDRADVFNSGYLFDQTVEFVRERELRIHRDAIEDLVERGRSREAEQLALSVTPVSIAASRGLEVGSDAGYERIEAAFAEGTRPLVQYPGAIGQMLSSHLTRGGFVAFMASEKRGKCIPGDQLVLLSTGETLPISEIVRQKRRDIVSYDELNDKFVSAQVSHFHVNGPKKVWAVVTRTGRRVKTTGNHPFLTTTGWQELQFLVPGQYIAVPKHIPIFGDDLRMPDEQVKLMAYFIADGCLGNESREHVNFTKQEVAIRRDFEWCVRLMGCSVKWDDDGLGGDVQNSADNRHKHGKNFVRNFLRDQGLMRKRSYEKVIPQSVYQLPRSKIALFLAVLIACDGCINPDGSIGFGVANERLSRQVQELLSRFGIVSKLHFKANDKRGSWAVDIRDRENIDKFGEHIGILFRKKARFQDAAILWHDRPSSKSFLDKFPSDIAARFYDELEEEFEVVGSSRSRWDDNWRRFVSKFTRANSVRNQIKLAAPLMRRSFEEVRDTKAGAKYMNLSILWDEIVSIEYVGIEDTFDLTVDDHHNFVAENVIVHNTWWMLDMAFRALRQKANVAFFQAGDLTEGQMLRRIAIHVARRSDDETYCSEYWRPVGDCEFNQFDTCRRADRNCDHGIYDSQEDFEKFREDPESFQNFKTLSSAAEQFPDYQPCDSSVCRVRRPAVWLRRMPEKHPLVGRAAASSVRKFFERYRRRFRLATYASDTLTAQEIISCCNEWERQDDFVPDVIVVDYADLMTADVHEFRHRQDAIWKGLRGLSQRRHALVVTCTQADADSYRARLLKLTNFSEDKRKLSHVTAMFGLNQTPDGREKELGVMRVNALLVREGAFSVTSEVTVLQDLRVGRPFLESWT